MSPARRARLAPAAAAVCVSSAILTLAPAVRADPVPTAAPAVVPPSAAPAPAGSTQLGSTAALTGQWPPALVFERRSTGLMVTGIVFAATASVVGAVGAVVYATAQDDCLDKHLGIGQRPGEFCRADRSQFDVGMTTMAVSGAVFALAVPVAVWAGSDGPRPGKTPPPSVGFRAGPGGAVMTVSF